MLNTHRVIEAILDTLFVAEDRRHVRTIDRLCDANQTALRMQLDGFMYEGKFYRRSTAPNGAGPRLTLDLSLWSKMQDFLADLNEVEQDRQSIKQFLFRTMDHCISRDEIRDAVPDCIADALPEDLRHKERRFNVDFFLRHPRDHRLYERVLPRLQFYSAARMLY